MLDGDDFPLNGVNVRVSKTKQCITDYLSDGSFDGALDGTYRINSVFVGNNVFVDGSFSRFEQGSTALSIHAEDISGTSYDKTVLIANASNPSSIDGGLPATLKISPKLTSYHVVTSSSDASKAAQIHLHRDLSAGTSTAPVDTLTHFIRRRSESDPLAESARYRAEVNAVSAKLSSMGFRQDDAGARLDPNTKTWGGLAVETAHERALKLFQTLFFVEAYTNQVFDAAVEVGNSGAKYSSPGALGKQHVTGQVNLDTLGALNLINGVIWTRAWPANWKPKSAATKLWVAGTVLKALSRIGDVHTITDASMPRGGKFEKHNTHSVGTAIDTRWRGPDGVEGPGTKNPATFYRPLSGQSYDSITGHFNSKNETVQQPVSNEEYSLSRRSADAKRLRTRFPTWSLATARRRAEINAFNDQYRQYRWIVAEEYDRDATYKFLDTLAKLPQRREIYFSDPALLDNKWLTANALTSIAGLKRIDNHGDHIHVSFTFNKTKVLPWGTDGAPDWRAFNVAVPLSTSAPPGQLGTASASAAVFARFEGSSDEALIFTLI